MKQTFHWTERTGWLSQCRALAGTPSPLCPEATDQASAVDLLEEQFWGHCQRGAWRLAAAQSSPAAVLVNTGMFQLLWTTQMPQVARSNLDGFSKICDTFKIIPVLRTCSPSSGTKLEPHRSMPLSMPGDTKGTILLC